MKKTVFATLFFFATCANAGGIVVIGNSNVPKMNVQTIQRIYMGKVLAVEGIDVRPIALKRGDAVRNHFLQDMLKQDEDKYTAYWTVRSFVGKGIAPMELQGSANVIEYVKSTPGAIGYIEEANLKSGMNVVAR